MSVDRDWGTPRLPINGEIVPYLGKPPLHFWLTASAFSALGFDEWVARVPSYLSFVFLCWCVWSVAGLLATREVGLVAIVIFASTTLGFFCSGASIVDFTLAACVGGALTAFAHFALAAKPRHRLLPGALVFLAATFAFMTKGPIGIALSGIPILGWSIARRDRKALVALPWTLGASLFFVVTAPWFYLNEQANPGFIRYFFLHENIGRFLFTNYGDKYGTGHQQPFGTIWAYYAAGCIPWTPLLIGELLNSRTRPKLFPLCDRSAFVFLCLWAAGPLLMFTMARQLLITYVVPGLAGFSLVAAMVFSVADLAEGLRKRLVLGVYSLAILTTAAAIAYFALGYDTPVSPVILLPLLFTLGMPLAVFRKPTLRQSDLLAAFSLSFAAFLSIVLILLEEPVSRRFSAKPILRCLTKTLAMEPTVVGLLGQQNSASSFFYVRAEAEEIDQSLTLVPVQSIALTERVPRDLIIPRKAKGVDLDSIPSHYSLVTSLGSWSWVSTREIQFDGCDAG